VHAAAQLIGHRSHQCDATATWTSGDRRAYALLDGIGSEPAVQRWVTVTARRLAHAAANRGAEPGLRAVHDLTARARRNRGLPGGPSAVAVVAVVTPAGVEVAWCGDARAYHLAPGGELVRLTKDHNFRQFLIDMGREPVPGARNRVYSYLGYEGDDVHIGTATAPAAGHLLLASDGAYEPLEDAGLDLATLPDRRAPYGRARPGLRRGRARQAGPRGQRVRPRHRPRRPRQPTRRLTESKEDTAVTPTPPVCPKTVRGSIGDYPWPCILAEGHAGECEPQIDARYYRKPVDTFSPRVLASELRAALHRAETAERAHREDPAQARLSALISRLETLTAGNRKTVRADTIRAALDQIWSIRN